MLALWEYFWVEPDWVAPPPPAPTPTPTPVPVDPGNPANAGGGGHRKRNDYERRGEDFWLVRERYLRRFFPKLKKPIEEPVVIENDNETVPPEFTKLDVRPPGGGFDQTILLRQALDALLQRANTARDAATLQNAVQRATQLQLDIAKIQQQNHTRAIALLLLDAF